MKDESANDVPLGHNQPIEPVKTRKQMSEEYGITEKTFARKLKHHQIELPSGVIMPKYQKLIYEALGEPPKKQDII